MLPRFLPRIARPVFAGLLLTCGTVPGATLFLTTPGPFPSTNDAFNLTGAVRDGENVGNGTTQNDGAANDLFTYVAPDGPHQGQTFRTGLHPAGYRVRSVWLRHAGYTANTEPTWWRMDSGAVLTARITDPSMTGTTGFVLHVEFCTTSGNEGWAGTHNSLNGDDSWVRIEFATPVHVQPDAVYGFDLSCSGPAFFEWLGTSNNAYASGSAYNGSTEGASDNTLNLLAGDRVFVVELAPAGPEDPPSEPEVVLAADPFPLERVRLLASRFKQNQDSHRTGYLAWLNPDRLLYPFRANAGLPQPPGVTHLGGWEGGSGFTVVRGHMLGHYLTAASKMYAATSDTAFLPKIQHLVAELRICQDALAASEATAGRPYGYLSGFPSSYFNTLETTPSSAQVPFYTIHKILAGLIDAHRYTGNPLALDIAIAMSDYHQWRVAQCAPAQVEAMFRTDNGNTEEWGAMNEALTDLYLLSTARGDSNAQRHLTFARIFHRDWFINPLFNNQDNLSGLHANTHVPQVAGFARVASLLGASDPERARLYTAASNFWNLVIDRHWLVIGGNSFAEHFQAPGRETGIAGSALSWNTAETCNTHNMLKLTKELFQHHPTARLADYYEHALYNHILASFETNAGMTTYFVPLNSGHFKTYCKPEGSCWCCTGTGIENTPAYNQAIYFHKTNVLWVNLFIPSELNWTERGMTVRLDTAFPATNAVTLTFTSTHPTNAAIRLRIPGWVSAPPVIKLNGVVIGAAPAPGTFHELLREWTTGDQVELTLPMSLRIDRSMDEPALGSIFFGPILLAGDLGTNGMPASDQATDQWDFSAVPVAPVPSLVGNSGETPDAWIQPGDGPLHFTAAGMFPSEPARRTVSLRPFIDIHHVRYAVYWNLLVPQTKAAWSGGAGVPNWSAAGNWNTVPTSHSSLEFGTGAGAITANDLPADAAISGIQFPLGAGAFTLDGNRITLRGDISNHSSAIQTLNLPVLLAGSLIWNLHTTGKLVLGGAWSGIGGFQKTGTGSLQLSSDASFNGILQICEGSLRVGNGGAQGRLLNGAVQIGADGELVFDRTGVFSVTTPISGSGNLAMEGAGLLELKAPATHSGETIVRNGTLRISSETRPVLKHRWSFDGNLNDSAGGSPAEIVNVGPNNTSLSATAITLSGGSRASADYVSLGSGLLPKDGSPVTLELWTTQVSAQNWSRIFDVGDSTSENLFMCWSQGTDTARDRVEWKDSATATADNSNAPYTPGTEYHIVLTIEPGAGANGVTRVTWRAAPSAASTLGDPRGSFETPDAPADFTDTHFWLGRSHYGGDATANATYNEVRVWNRSFTTAEMEQLHDFGPSSTGSFATQTVLGRLSGDSPLRLENTAVVDLAGTDQEVASLSGTPGVAIHLDGGCLRILGGGDSAAAFAGSISGNGCVQIDGTLRLIGNASISPEIKLVNNGTLDLIRWTGSLPPGFTNLGAVLDRSAVRIDSCHKSAATFSVTFHAYSGHRYQLQWRTFLFSGDWIPVSDLTQGTDAPMTLSHGFQDQPAGAFYRVSVNP